MPAVSRCAHVDASASSSHRLRRTSSARYDAVAALDGVTDPHNLGACLRTADGAGVHAVIATRDKSAGLTPVACKVASGAAESVPFIQVTNLARTMKLLADDYRVWIVGTAGEAEGTLYDMDFSGNLAIVMGSEEKGMRRLTRDNCDALVKLPMLGSVESLNVSVATGVVLYEVVRQKNRNLQVALQGDMSA